MNIVKYEYSVSDTYLDFEFDSDGPKGKVKKVVRYSYQVANGVSYYNLGFGDLDPSTGRINDLVVTNNKDREKVLATVAATVLDFTKRFPDAIIYAKGSTLARTRLYQIGIAANWDEIDSVLYVYGYEKDRGWEPFRKNVSYGGFLITGK
jgi:hypothetical protein